MRMEGKTELVTAAGSGMRRVGRSEEIANAALFLLSNEASFITGAALPVDGGITAWKFGRARHGGPIG